MFAFKGQRKTELNDNPLYMGYINYGQLHGTKIVLSGNHQVMSHSSFGLYQRLSSYNVVSSKLIPVKGADGKHQKMKKSPWGTMRYEYQFSPLDSWVVVSIHKNEPLIQYTPQGKREKGLTNLIGVSEKDYVEQYESVWDSEKGFDIVKLIPFSTISAETGIINHAHLFSILSSESQSNVPVVHMTWKAFNESVQDIYQPRLPTTLPIGTRMYIRPYDEVKSELELDKGLKGLTAYVEEYFQEYGDSHRVITYKATRMPCLGFLNPRRKTAIVFPRVTWTKKRIKRFKARSEPKYIERVSYRPNSFKDYRLYYATKETMKNRPNMFKKKSSYNALEDKVQNLAVFHYLIKKGYIVLDGRYSGKNEMKTLFNKGGFTSGDIPKDEVFDYGDDIPPLSALYPSL